MSISELAERMIAFSQGNLHDIDHFLRVHAYARIIGQLEALDEHTQFLLEAAALVHDIACPLCREKYGCTNGKYQEQEGGPLARAFLAGTDLAPEDAERIVYLVSRHHSYGNVDGADYQILLEADYLANAGERGTFPRNLKSARKHLFRTQSGIALLRSIYGEAAEA